jgi:hypothetical protein
MERLTWVIANNGEYRHEKNAWKVIEFEEFEIDPDRQMRL